MKKPSVLMTVYSVSLLLSLFVIGSILPAQAQLYTGSVTGLVKDFSGAMIPGAAVTLVDEGKGFSFAATTDSDGRYLFRSVPPSVYHVLVKAKGFKSQIRGGIRV